MKKKGMLIVALIAFGLYGLYKYLGSSSPAVSAATNVESGIMRETWSLPLVIKLGTTCDVIPTEAGTIATVRVNGRDDLIHTVDYKGSMSAEPGVLFALENVVDEDYVQVMATEGNINKPYEFRCFPIKR